MVESTLVDFQEAQSVFALTVAITTIVSFAAGKAGLANIASVFSYLINSNTARGLVLAGMYPLLWLQLIMHRAKKRSWNTLLFVAANWASIVYISARPMDAKIISNNLKKSSTIRACGYNLGPMTYCRGPTGYDGDGLGIFNVTLCVQFLIHALFGFLLVDRILYPLKWFFSDTVKNPLPLNTIQTGSRLK